MTAWAKALNACQTADLLENRNSDRPSHSPAHIGPGADVGDRQRKLLSCIFRFTPGRLSRLDRVSEYRASVCLCVPLFSHFGGATANRQVPAPITAKEAAVRHGGAGGHRVRGSASSLVCSQTQVSGLPRRDGPDSYKARGFMQKSSERQARSRKCQARKASTLFSKPEHEAPFQCPPTKPFQCPPTRRGGLSLR